MSPVMRSSGVLLHVASLPSLFGVGDLGPGAYHFADFLADAGQRHWQVLPLNPTNPFAGNSPYSSDSAFAGNRLFISPERLVEAGLLEWRDLESRPDFPWHRCAYPEAMEYKEGLLAVAYERFRSDMARQHAFQAFCASASAWLDDYVLFVAIKRSCGGKGWFEWPTGLKDRKPETLDAFTKDHNDELEREKFFQYIFFDQWKSLKSYCTGKGIGIIGDVALYVSYDSADVWAHPEIFKLDGRKKPVAVSGVPPDYFSATGQLWGTPVYRWSELKKNGFAWWIERMNHHFMLFDTVRIDHFRGLVAYWEVPAGESTAIHGKWVNVPLDEFFGALFQDRTPVAIIAEDLGVITDDVRDALARHNLPGMKILLFAFNADDPHHPYLPHNYTGNCVVYTGTHDNNTVRGWFEQEAANEDRWRFFRYAGRDIPAEEASWEMIRLAMASVAQTVIVPLQDILGLGQESRMNYPSVAHGNWEWRYMPDQLTRYAGDRLREMTTTYGRLPEGD